VEQAQVDELVERFYRRLVNDSYFSNMFAERKVDLELLKERQRAFIGRLANPQDSGDRQGEVQQVRERHQFGVDPDRAESWFNHMKEAMEEMKLEPEIMVPLLKKIQFLMNQMTEKGASRPESVESPE